MVPSTQFAQAISPINSNTCLTEHLIKLAYYNVFDLGHR